MFVRSTATLLAKRPLGSSILSLRARRQHVPAYGATFCSSAGKFQGAALAASQPSAEGYVSHNTSRSNGVQVDIGGETCIFPPAFLRDACGCPKCVDLSTRQKHFQTSDIPLDIKASVEGPSADGSLRISWTNDHPATAGERHVSEFSNDWLRQAHAKQLRLQTDRSPLRDRVTWNRERIEKDNLWVDYHEYKTSDKALLQALRQLQTHGLVFLRNVPDDESSVIDIAERVGPLRDSFYGRTWDVRSVPDAKNVAYTNQYLGLHMDLLYMTNPPHLQLLHSLRAKASGGESLFSDSFHAAETMRRESVEDFYALTQYPVTYHYHNASQHYEATRPTIELEMRGIVGSQGGVASSWDELRSNMSGVDATRKPHITSAISRINWSPPFQGPFQQDLDRFDQYHRAADRFNKLVNDEANVFEYRMAEGECMIFDNRRVLHARKAFDPTVGERWLKGAYVDDDAYWSRLRVLEETVR